MTQKAWRVTFVRAYVVDVFADNEEQAQDKAENMIFLGDDVNIGGLTHTDTVPLELDEDNCPIDE